MKIRPPPVHCGVQLLREADTKNKQRCKKQSNPYGHKHNTTSNIFIGISQVVPSAVGVGMESHTKSQSETCIPSYQNKSPFGATDKEYEAFSRYTSNTEVTIFWKLLELDFLRLRIGLYKNPRARRALWEFQNSNKLLGVVNLHSQDYTQHNIEYKKSQYS